MVNGISFVHGQGCVSIMVAGCKAVGSLLNFQQLKSKDGFEEASETQVGTQEPREMKRSGFGKFF